jgi:hypothetical protein
MTTSQTTGIQPTAEHLLTDPSTFSITAATPHDEVHQAYSEVLDALRTNVTLKRWTAASNVLARVQDSGHADVAHAFAADLANLQPDRSNG